MANYVGVPLAKLIRQRAYLSGDIKRISSEEDTARHELEAAIDKYRQLRNARKEKENLLSRIDGEIREISGIDPKDIRSINSVPRKGHWGHGEFTARLVNILREAGKPVQTGEVIKIIASYYELPITTSAERERVRRPIVERLRTLARRGAIKRLHALNKTLEGQWLWVGLD